MFGPIKKMRQAIRSHRDYNPELAYLNDSVDRIDLERRQREIDEGRFRRRPFY